MDEAAPAGAAGRRQRRIRNYLLDSRFQLKYAGYFVAIAVVLSTALGLILWRTSQELLTQSQRVVEQGQALVEEGRKVSDVVAMNIVEDPEYGDDPALKAAFEQGDQKYTEQLLKQQAQLEAESSQLSKQHRAAALLLLVALAVFVIVVGLAGIVVTHKVAGPVFKMKRQIQQVGAGHLKMPAQLRKGDELIDFFDAFRAMVQSLRQRQEQEIELFESTLAKLEGNAEEEQLRQLRELLAQMKGALD